jgi:hypothetical protein
MRTKQGLTVKKNGEILPAYPLNEGIFLFTLDFHQNIWGLD